MEETLTSIVKGLFDNLLETVLEWPTLSPPEKSKNTIELVSEFYGFKWENDGQTLVFVDKGGNPLYGPINVAAVGCSLEELARRRMLKTEWIQGQVKEGREQSKQSAATDDGGPEAFELSLQRHRLAQDRTAILDDQIDALRAALSQSVDEVTKQAHLTALAVLEKLRDKEKKLARIEANKKAVAAQGAAKRAAQQAARHEATQQEKTAKKDSGPDF